MTATVVLAEQPPWAKEAPAKDLPAIFHGKAQDRLAAEEVAKQDACRKLLERIYGLRVDDTTDVHDLTLASKTVDTSLQNHIRGMKEVDRKYNDDGSVELAMKVTLREVVEKIEESYKKVVENERIVTEEKIRNISQENRDKEIMAVGRGALRGSEGLQVIQAIRAAEADCYSKLAGRVFGMKINATTTVRDFVLANDRVVSKVCVCLLNGVKLASPEIDRNGQSCSIPGSITLREVVETLTRTTKRYVDGFQTKVEEIKNLETTNRDTVIAEVGKAAFRGAQAASTDSAGSSTYERKVVTERVLRKGIAVE
jgi:hypothetical protein